MFRFFLGMVTIAAIVAQSNRGDSNFDYFDSEEELPAEENALPRDFIKGVLNLKCHMLNNQMNARLVQPPQYDANNCAVQVEPAPVADSNQDDMQCGDKQQDVDIPPTGGGTAYEEYDNENCPNVERPNYPIKLGEWVKGHEVVLVRKKRNNSYHKRYQRNLFDILKTSIGHTYNAITNKQSPDTKIYYLPKTNYMNEPIERFNVPVVSRKRPEIQYSDIKRRRKSKKLSRREQRQRKEAKDAADAKAAEILQKRALLHSVLSKEIKKRVEPDPAERIYGDIRGRGENTQQ